MKETYETPEMEITEFDVEDVITTSDGTSESQTWPLIPLT